MFRRKVFSIGLRISVLIICLLGVSLSRQPSFAAAPSDSLAANEVKATIEKYFALLSTPIEQLDITRFREVLRDTSDYKLTPPREADHRKLGDLSKMQSAGYLTAMQAQSANMKQGETLRQLATAKAKTENREVTPQEWQEMTKQNNGIMPSFIYQGDAANKLPLRYDAITIDGDKAVVRLDDGAALQELILRKVNDHWFITELTPITVHF